MYTSADLDRCRASLKGGSRSFHLASLMLPRRMREPAAVLYAFCREADDLVDEGGGQHAVRVLLNRLSHLHSERGPIPQDALLAEVIQQYGVPTSVLEALVDGFAWDAEGKRYQTLDDLFDYAMRVAGSVGVAMALLMGARGRKALIAASSLGIAMQLTNICRDVGEDARLGRLYIPVDWMQAAGIDVDEWLLQPQFTPQIGEMVKKLLSIADQCYAIGDEGLSALPRDCRRGIRVARRLYAGIGHRLRRRGCDSLAGRTIVRPWGKLSCVLYPEIHYYSKKELDPCLRASERAAEFVMNSLPSHLLAPPAVTPEVDGHVAWAIDLFHRLDQRAMQRQSEVNQFMSHL
jgi:15-cis-phytoene synthase